MTENYIEVIRAGFRPYILKNDIESIQNNTYKTRKRIERSLSLARRMLLDSEYPLHSIQSDSLEK